ncbi:MAG: hypothetical protein HFJ55_00190 [Clostridia bacterium]|nr:hypothetical protein [Clostridia bacterium]
MVTLIVLFILASISISTLVGDNSIIQKSKDAKEATEIAEEKEMINVAVIKATGRDRLGELKYQFFKEELDK